MQPFSQIICIYSFNSLKTNTINATFYLKSSQLMYILEFCFRRLWLEKIPRVCLISFPSPFLSRRNWSTYVIIIISFFLSCWRYSKVLKYTIIKYIFCTLTKQHVSLRIHYWNFFNKTSLRITPLRNHFL